MDKEFQKKIETLEVSIGYKFSNQALLVKSLTHPSHAPMPNGERINNQRLEYLGDSVLSTVLAEKLYQLYPNDREGILSQYRSALSKGSHLANLARKLGINDCMRLSESERLNGGHKRDSALEDALEAIVGAIFIDSGYETTRRVILNWYNDIREAIEKELLQHNPKGRLQEQVQPILGNEALKYSIVKESGPAHQKTFEVELTIDDKPIGTGSGTSKKEAEEKAAQIALKKWIPKMKRQARKNKK